MRAGRGAPCGAVLILLAVAGPPPAFAASLPEARSLLVAGERARARAMLDGILAAPEGLSREATAEAAWLRATLEEDAAEAERRYRDLLGENPGPGVEAAVRLRLGRIAFTGGRFLEALGYFEDARRRGREEEGGLWAGLAASTLGDPGTARRHLERAVQSGNARVRQRAQMALGDLNRRAGAWTEAMSWYAQAEADGLGEGPGWGAEAALKRAACLVELGRDDDALELLAEIVRLDPAGAPAAEARDLLARAAAEEEAARAKREPPPPADTLAAVPADTTLAAYPDSAMPLDPEGGGERWAIQAGAFAQAANARSFAAHLRGQGFPVLVDASGDSLYRVLVGPFPEREVAETNAAPLSEFVPAWTIVRLDEPER